MRAWHNLTRRKRITMYDLMSKKKLTVLFGTIAVSFVLTAQSGCGRSGTSAVVRADGRPTPIGTPASQHDEGGILHGQGHNGDFTADAPGVRHLITVKYLPAPYASRSVDNGPPIVGRPENAWPKAPPGFKVEI